MLGHRSNGTRRSCVTRAICFTPLLPVRMTEDSNSEKKKKKNRNTLDGASMHIRTPPGEFVAALNAEGIRLTY